ncbi:MAG: hypothetical protein JOZ59_05285, partial [Candidatus Eremiobacteraeota bacterium]|nr:hypothetical protein [Candidatus Eremiobacteraeota bacterium]
MLRFFVSRIIRLVAVLMAITVISFFFLRMIPGDPVTIRLGEHATAQEIAAMRSSLGLDKPWYEQLGLYVGHA